MAKIGVIGDKDAVLLYRAVGLDVYTQEDGEHAARCLHQLSKEGYAVIFLQEKYLEACREAIGAFKAEAYPAVVPIPDSHGSQGTGMKTLKENVEKAVGVDILFNN